VLGHHRAVGVPAEPGQQIDLAPEPAQPEGDIRGAATRVLVDRPVQPVHDVDERLTDDERMPGHAPVPFSSAGEPGPTAAGPGSPADENGTGACLLIAERGQV